MEGDRLRSHREAERDREAAEVRAQSEIRQREAAEARAAEERARREELERQLLELQAKLGQRGNAGEGSSA